MIAAIPLPKKGERDAHPVSRALVDYLRRPDSCVKRERLARRLRLCIRANPALLVVESADDWRELLKL